MTTVDWLITSIKTPPVCVCLQVLYIIEEDKGDGWTRARKQSGEEGYVPTSYVDITLEKNSKGAVTYI